jgi:flavin reductase (DIM6/NTAB) family NADH-FMN oxidoreductase RutF
MAVCDDRRMEPQDLRSLMSRWVTGVAVVTSTDGTGPRGATTNALTSLSLDPLLVLVALDHGSNTLEAVRNSGRFCINVLAADQEELARRFATKASGEEKLAGVPHQLVDGVPVLAGAVAWVACALDHELEGGDHTILLGRPIEARLEEDAQPLLFYGGRFHAGALRR